MNRRAFFKLGVDKTKKTIVKGADSIAKKRASHWIRPPYAIDELEFLLACTRCGDCISACPHQVIFSLSSRLGAQVVGTPAMDLLNKGCHMCEDWPCVTSCTPRALKMPEIEDDVTPTLPRLAVARIDTKHCLPYSGPECGACNASCPVDQTLVWDMTKPKINPATCTGCGLCREACIVSPKAITIHTI